MDWLPDAWPWISGGIAAFLGFVGRRPISSRLRCLKQAIFDLGSLTIRLEAAEADNRALTEALRRCRAANAVLSDACDALPSGATENATATSGTVPTPSPMTRS